MAPFCGIRPARRDQPDRLLLFAIDMADDELSKIRAGIEEDEKIRVSRVHRVVDDASLLVEDRGTGLLEADAVFPAVLRVLG